VPAPARISTGPSVVSTACRWAGFKEAKFNIGAAESKSPRPERKRRAALQSLAVFGSATVLVASNRSGDGSVASVGVLPAESVLRRASPIGEQNKDIAEAWGGRSLAIVGAALKA